MPPGRTPDSAPDISEWKGSVTSTLKSIDDQFAVLRGDFHQHEKNDARAFASINESLSDLKISQARWASGLFVALTIAAWVLPPIVKRIIGAE